MEWVQNGLIIPNLVELTVLVAATSAWFFNYVKTCSFYLGYFPRNLLHKAITSDKTCPFSIDAEYDGLYVRDFSAHDSPGELIAAKLATFMDYLETPEVILKFLLDQIKFSHLLNEVVISHKLMLTGFSIVFAIILIDHVVVGRISTNFITDYLVLERMERTENEQLHLMTRKFFSEKILVLGFVISQNYIDTSHFTPNLKDFASFVSSKFAVASVTSDSTVFAIWYCYVYFVLYVTQSIFLRFVLTLKNGSNLSQNLQSNPSIISTSCILLILFTFSSFLYGLSLMAYNFINPYYATLLVFDAFHCWLRCAYTLFRVTYLISTAARNAEDPLNGGESAAKMRTVKMVYDAIAHLLMCLQYSLYIGLGCFVTQKFVVVIFCRQLAGHLKRLAKVGRVEVEMDQLVI